MGAGKGRRHVARDLQRILQRELLLPDQAIPQRLARRVRHHVVDASIGLAGID
jgi:hypothetical protein